MRSTEERPRKDPARRQPSACQGARPQEEPKLLAPRLGPSRHQTMRAQISVKLTSLWYLIMAALAN